MKLKTFLTINAISILLFFLLTATVPLNPKGEIFEKRPVFKWLGMPSSYTVLIDDNPEFTTPVTAKVEGNSYVPEENLGLGEHYWKVEGIRGGKAQKFTIASTVSLKTEEDSIRNDGNTRLKLDLKPSITGAVILDINQTIRLGEETEEVSARQDE